MSLLLLQGHGLDLIVLWVRFSRCLKSIVYLHVCVIKKVDMQLTVKALQWVLPKNINSQNVNSQNINSQNVNSCQTGTQ